MRTCRERLRPPIGRAGAAVRVRRKQRDQFSHALAPPHRVVPVQPGQRAAHGPPNRIGLVFEMQQIGLRHQQYAQRPAQRQPGRSHGERLPVLPQDRVRALDDPPDPQKKRYVIRDLHMPAPQIDPQRHREKQGGQQARTPKRPGERQHEPGREAQRNEPGIVPRNQNERHVGGEAVRHRRQQGGQAVLRQKEGKQPGPEEQYDKVRNRPDRFPKQRRNIVQLGNLLGIGDHVPGHAPEGVRRPQRLPARLLLVRKHILRHGPPPHRIVPDQRAPGKHGGREKTERNRQQGDKARDMPGASVETIPEACLVPVPGVRQRGTSRRGRFFSASRSRHTSDVLLDKDTLIKSAFVPG